MPDQPTPAPIPAPAPPSADVRTWLVYLVRELGLTTCLIGFICWQMAIQMPQLRDDFRGQTDRLNNTVENNSRATAEQSRVTADQSRVMGELAAEIKALRYERKNP